MISSKKVFSICFAVFKASMSSAAKVKKRANSFETALVPKRPKKVSNLSAKGATIACMETALSDIALADESDISDQERRQNSVIDVFCYAQRLFHETFGLDACQSNALFEFQTLRMLRRVYDDKKNSLTYSGNVRTLADALENSTGILHEFKSRQIKMTKTGLFHVRSSTPIGTWQHPDSENVVEKMSDTNRRTTYALRHIGALEPVFAIHICSAAGRMAEIKLYKMLTNQYAAKKSAKSAKNSTYIVTCGMLLDCIGPGDYLLFIHGEKVSMPHESLLYQMRSAAGFQIEPKET